MFEDEEWEDLRSKIYEETKNKYDSFFKQWINEAFQNKNITVSYSFRDHVLTVFTNRPGCMIGRYGTLVDKYKNIYRDLFHDKTAEIKFVEVDDFLTILD